MSVHSKILVHWTGQKQIKNDCADESKGYVDLLEKILRRGFVLKQVQKEVVVDGSIRNLRRLCFTEVRLNQAKTHAKRCGKLGLGFKRDFILNRGGRPVIYFPLEPDMKSLEEYFNKAYKKLKLLYNQIKQINRNLIFKKLIGIYSG